MRTRIRLLTAGALCTLFTAVHPAFSQGTAFTYQGRLGAGGTPANGLYDLRFDLRDAATGGASLGSVTTNAVAVSNGLFTVTLDYGAAPWTGAPRWLEIGVKTNGGGSFTTLAPRQPITAAPYAIDAGSAATAATMPWGGLTAVPVGNGLILGGGNTFTVNFGGDGVANTVSRSDHDHYGQAWSGAASVGLSLATTANANYAAALRAQQGTYIDYPTTPSGLRGTSSDGYGVIGSGAGVGGVFGTALTQGVVGFAADLSASTIGVQGNVASTAGTGVRGFAFATNGSNVGVSGETPSAAGVGVRGLHSNTQGTNAGVVGVTESLDYAAAGVLGLEDSTTPNLRSAGVRGINHGTNYPGIGVFGSQDGSGWGVFGETPTGVGVVGHSSVGPGLFGLTEGSLTNSYTSDGTPGVAVLGQASGIGPSIGVSGKADSDEGIGVQGRHTSLQGNTAGVHGVTDSQAIAAVGVLGEVSSTTPGVFSTAVWGVNFGTGGNGIGVYGEHNGSGRGVYGSTVGPGIGVYGESPGTGVYGRGIDTNGVGVWAEGAGATNVALAVSGGSIRVTGAGLGTSTPVFIHRATGGNIHGDWTTIDHPLCNGDPNAILIVTQNWNPGGAGGIFNPHPVGVWYDGSHWAVFNEDSTGMTTNAAFNVFVVKP